MTMVINNIFYYLIIFDYNFIFENRLDMAILYQSNFLKLIITTIFNNIKKL